MTFFTFVSFTFGAVTITLQTASLELPDAFAVMLQTPIFTPVTTPLTTVAIFSSLDFHSIAWFASDGVTLAVSVTVPPTATFFCGAEITTDSATAPTLTVHVTLLPSAVAVIVALPTLTPLTLPELLTVAIFSSLVVQVIFLSVASFGSTSAFKDSEPPTSRKSSVLFSVTDATGTFTLTLQVAETPFSAFALIVTVPSCLPVTTPPATVAILSSLLDHSTL